jgi:D-arabinose 5-phosphate isomerase GutQ
MSEYSALIVNKGDVAIGISASGGTAFVHEFLRIVREKGAHTISITENADTPLGKYSDIIIKSNAKPEGASSSKIQTAQLAIGHALMITLADERGVTAEQSIGYMLPHKVENKMMGIK